MPLNFAFQSSNIFGIILTHRCFFPHVSTVLPSLASLVSIDPQLLFTGLHSFRKLRVVAMTFSWGEVKDEIERLYMREGKSLKDVRDILKEKRNFNAS